MGIIEYDFIFHYIDCLNVYGFLCHICQMLLFKCSRMILYTTSHLLVFFGSNLMYCFKGNKSSTEEKLCTVFKQIWDTPAT